MLNANEIKNASYNPRDFNPKNYEALGESMDEFGDISGITYNKKTKNLITGHHRWNQICQKWGVDSLSLKSIDGTDIFVICENGYDTGYTLRQVSWDLDKEKMANITANSELVSGYFTDKLKGLISGIGETNKLVVSKLRLEEIKIPKIKVKNNLRKDTEEPKRNKSETLISGGGETYLTLRLELTPETAKDFQEMLDKFKNKGDGVEEPLKRIIGFMNTQEPEEVIKSTRVRKRNS